MTRELQREVLLSFWKVQILHHAQRRPVVGHWAILELRRHGHDVSPGTLYPLLARMERRGWLTARRAPGSGSRGRREYYITAKGRKVLATLRRDVEELHREVVRREGADEEPPRPR